VEQEGAPGAWTRLGQHLRRHAPEREPGVDEVLGQVFGSHLAALEDGVESDQLRVGHAVLDLVEPLALVQVRGVDDMPGRAELVGERDHPGGQTLGVVEEQDLSHGRQLIGQCDWAEGWMSGR